MEADFQANLLVAGQRVPQSLFLLISAAHRRADESQTPVSSCQFPSVDLLHSPGLESSPIHLIRGKSDYGRAVCLVFPTVTAALGCLSLGGQVCWRFFTHLRANPSSRYRFRRWSNLSKSMSSMPSHAKALMLCSV